MLGSVDSIYDIKMKPGILTLLDCMFLFFICLGYLRLK